MSFTVYWEKLDRRVAQSVQAQLNAFFANPELRRPAFLGPITVDSLDFGSVPPHVEIIDMTAPFPEFYMPAEDDGDGEADNDNDIDDMYSVPVAAYDAYAGIDDDLESVRSRLPDRPPSQATVRSYFAATAAAATPICPTPPVGVRLQHLPPARTPPCAGVAPSEDDLQLLARVAYSGDMSVVLRTELQLNYPATQFASLPVTLHITRIEFAAVAVVAHLLHARRVNLCFLEPEPPRASLLDSFAIRTEIGDAHHHVLKNVEQLERFITEQLRSAIDHDFVFPAYHSFEL
ncbi:Mitochondrial distribution and morphology protein 12 [Coemansia erecta]|uniref:Mitochondrial distribution and morphology protein 12 n=1 Tax=Coemansia erecta TaxID=147472 RepID=A0A9W8CNP6_9FUNG|nr:Mitochondrial distribution and morphology protein 12 [Coemansia erecta]